VQIEPPRREDRQGKSLGFIAFLGDLGGLAVDFLSAALA
jgi:hypothetical protein